MKQVRKTIAMPVPFDDRTIEYIVEGFSEEKTLTGKTNPKTWKLMKEGYVVLKNFIPKEIINMTMDSWKRIELDPKLSTLMEAEIDPIFESPKDTLNKSTGAYNTPFGVALHRWLWDNLKSVIDMDLQETYSYTRRYERGAYLKAHADRPSCEISATICLDYKTDDNKPWSIWVDNSQDFINWPDDIYEDTQAIPIRKRKTSKRIDLEVGDVLLYQGPNVAHWRERLLGDHSYHVFCHFFNVQSQMMHIPTVKDIQAKYFNENDTIRVMEKDYNPCTFDGRPSRWHPQNQNDWEQRYYNEFMDNVWHNDRLWLAFNKSDYVNRYEEFKQVKDGKTIDKENFTPKDKDIVEKLKRKRPQY